MRRQEGRLGDPETAKTALDYVVAVSVNAREAAERGDAWKHVGLLVKQEKNWKVFFWAWVLLLKAFVRFAAAIQVAASYPFWCQVKNYSAIPAIPAIP